MKPDESRARPLGMRRRRRRWLARTGVAPLVAAALLAGSTSTGCFMSARTAQTIGQVATVALWTAAIAGQLAVLAVHDAHYHHEHCGHYRRWHEDRWVYYYEGRWEYYDGDAEVWYYYAE